MDVVTSPEVYIEALQISLEKKLRILNRLYELTKEQSDLLAKDEIDFDGFNKLFEEKSVGIEELNQIDEGFMSIFNLIKEGIKENPKKYQKEIEKLQDTIAKVTDEGVRLEAAERRNNENMDMVLKNNRKKIQSFNKSNAAVSQYYKNMNSGVVGESFFLDRKK